MVNLEELHIEDTPLSLANLVQVFKICKNIEKLSLSLSETLEVVLPDEELEILEQNFQQLVTLKIFAYSVYYYDSWMVILEVLRYYYRFKGSFY